MKNIILIITDSFRYDNLGDKAVRPVRTPELDNFAEKRATVIDNFYTGSFPTIPHRTDLVSGTSGWPHYGWQSIKDSSNNHIASLLAKSEYATQLICDCPHLFKSEFHHDFDAAYQHRGQEGDKPLLHLNDEIKTVVSQDKTRVHSFFRGHSLVDQHRWTNRYYKYEGETFADRTSRTAIRWLEENYKANPFFLWVDFFDPHEPWDPPEYLVNHYHPNYEGEAMLHPNYGLSSDYTEEELKNMWAHYAAESEIVDRKIGMIIQKINDLQLWDDTIVIVTSDHGISLGEHERVGKTNDSKKDKRFWPLYPEVSHVPFLIAGGDIPGGNNLDLIAQPIDILPTLGQLAGVSLTPEEKIQGVSFAEQILTGKGAHREYAVSGSHFSFSSRIIPDYATTPFLVTDKWGYTPVGANGSVELYDIKKDPLATNDIADKNKKIVEELHELFISHLLEVGAPKDFMSLWK